MSDTRIGRLVRSWVPRWWAGEGGAIGRVLDVALWPAEYVFRGIVHLRGRLYDRGLAAVARGEIPVISIGNLSIGGAGKTPFSAWVAGRLFEQGAVPAVVLRGYGEDEILLHRELNPHVPVFAGAQRARSVAAASAAGCTVAVLDDAFQHRALERDLDVVLIAAESWTGSRRLLPRGPWREDTDALRRADAVVVTRKAASATRAREVAAALSAADVPFVASCSILPERLAPLHGGDDVPLSSLHGREILAAAALADPRPFEAHLQEVTGSVELVAFPDHHTFTRAEAEEIMEWAAGRLVVVTHKDAVKLRPLLPASSRVLVLHQRLVIEEGGEELMAALARTATRDGR